MTAKRSSHGGARAGAGRPALFHDRQGLTVQLERTDYDALALMAKERNVSVGALVREALHAYITRRRRG